MIRLSRIAALSGAAASLIFAGLANATDPPRPQELSTVVVRAFPADDRTTAGPFSADTLGTSDIRRTDSPAILDAIQQRSPGAFLSDVNGNPASQVLDFRGFAASPVPGQAQGLAVYLGSVRLNEAFGDTVNWDLVPTIAVEQADVLTGDPAFGLNAVGGAVALRMKTGKSFQGGAVTLEGGSFGRGGGSAEYGRRDGDWNLYLAADGEREDGWRLHSPSSATRLYADIGRDFGRLEAHLIGAASASVLGVVGPTPVDLLAQNREAVFTSPQKTRNDDALVALDLRWRAGPWSVTGGLHARTFNQAHTDGNDADVERCSSRATNPLFGTLCLEDDDFPAALRPPAAAFQILGPDGAPIACPRNPAGTPTCTGIPYGTIDRTRTESDTLGGVAQAAYASTLLGRPSRLTLGAAVDTSDFQFSAQSELGYIGPDFVVAPRAGIPGQGLVIRTAGLIGYAPLAISGRRSDYGLYGAEVLDLTPSLSFTLSGRYNEVDLRTTDRLGTSPDLNAGNHFSRFNPQAGLTWKALPAVSLHAAYSEGTRAPTPLELSCADPARPCLLENALVADPPLKQVVSHTGEAGATGAVSLFGGKLAWRVTGFRTDVDDDIVALASEIQGRGYFANVPRTRREGVELGATFENAAVSAYFGYSHIEATYRFDGRLSSPNNPSADADGTIAVTAGDAIGGIPQDRLKLGGDWWATPRLTLGADLLATGEQPFVGDENGGQPKLPGWATVNLHAGYRLTPRLTLFAQIYNLFDEDYATYGTFFDADGVANAGSSLPADPDPRTITPAPPRSIRAGVRYRW